MIDRGLLAMDKAGKRLAVSFDDGSAALYRLDAPGNAPS